MRLILETWRYDVLTICLSALFSVIFACTDAVTEVSVGAIHSKHWHNSFVPWQNSLSLANSITKIVFPHMKMIVFIIYHISEFINIKSLLTLASIMMYFSQHYDVGLKDNIWFALMLWCAYLHTSFIIDVPWLMLEGEIWDVTLSSKSTLNT